jgi:hypothetical protein
MSVQPIGSPGANWAVRFALNDRRRRPSLSGPKSGLALCSEPTLTHGKGDDRSSRRLIRAGKNRIPDAIVIADEQGRAIETVLLPSFCQSPSRRKTASPRSPVPINRACRATYWQEGRR